MARVLVGTSGWSYSSWRKDFYPKKLPANQFLEFYAKQFPTAEINNSFYHLPKPETYAKWAAQVPKDFVFAVKASRFITHIKRLLDVKEAWGRFLGNTRSLRPHLGPILFQFPESFRCDRDRLEKFLRIVGKSGERLVFEFRHESWFTNETYQLLTHHNAALCIADSPKYPRKDVLTADFGYVRFHGRTKLFTSSYTKAQLAAEAKKIKRYVKEGKEIFVYFNNDAKGAATRNAGTLRTLLEE